MARKLIRQISLLVLLLLVTGAALPVQARPVLPAGPHPAAALKALVTHIVFSPPSPNILPLGQNISFTFNYDTTYPAGVRIFGRPFTQGALTPNYAANPSPLYSSGAGSGSGFFTISSGDVTVDQVRFQIVAADTGAILQEYFVPVSYQFSSSGNLVSNILLSPTTPNLLRFGQQVTLTFDYGETQPGGVYIFPRPMTGGNPTPNYGASGSALLNGNGATNDFFEITSGPNDVTVDQIRFTITDNTRANVIATFYLPVSYQVTGSVSAVTQITLSPPNPNILHPGDFVNLSFNYVTSEAGGVRIFVFPYSGGSINPHAADSGSPLYATGSGTGTGFVTLFSANGLVDGIRVEMTDANQTTVLFDKILPVNYQFWQEAFWLYLPVIFH